MTPTQTPVRATLEASGFDESADVWTFNGVVIENDEKTNGAKGSKFWPAAELERAAGQLEGKPVVDGHSYDDKGRPTNDAVAGKVTADWYDPRVGWRYEMEVGELELARKLHNGHLEVSFHGGGAKTGETDDGAAVMANIVSADLAIVPYGGARGNDVNPGTAPAGATPDAASAAALSGSIDPELVAELQDATINTPEYDGTSTASWSAPSLETYGDEMDAARNAHVVHFADAETVSDLALPVVDGDRQLNRNALESAWSMAPQVDGLNDDEIGRARDTLLQLANSEWDDENHDVGSTETQNEHTTPTDMDGNNPDGGDGLELEGRVVIDEERHAELTNAEDDLERVLDERDDLEAELSDANDQLDKVRSVYAARLAELSGFSEEFFEDKEIDVLETELENQLELEDGQDAAEAALSGAPTPQTGDGGSNGSGGGEPEEIAELREKKEAALEAEMTAAAEHYDDQIAELENGGN